MLQRKTLNILNQKPNKVNYARKTENVFSSDKPIKNKQNILCYLEMYYPNIHTTGNVFDNVKQQEVKDLIDSGYYDGVYYWDETDIYHFKKYNMPLNEEFIKYVLSKNI